VPATPYTVVDLARLEANIVRMSTLVRGRGTSLRPHAKTHKTVEIARRQLDAGAVGLTVATVHEATTFAAAGVDDIFIAFPVWPDAARASALRSLHDTITVRVGIDGVEAATALGAAMRGTARPLGVLVEIDSGLHRSGVTPAVSVIVADAARAAGLDVVGVFTHGGHAYAGADAVDGAAEDERRALENAATRLRDTGHDVRVVSAGSTPTAARSGPPVTELRPGTYVFGDGAQVALGACGEDDVALRVRATVVSAAVPGQVVIDAGSKALSSDRRPWQHGHGTLLGHPGCVVERLSEEHGIVTAAEGCRLPKVGEIVEVVPNHVCSVVNLSPELVVLDGDRIVDRWPVAARR
jgi:D-serine deaminase-like pyridoxal phosphate-dependent protein